MTLIGIWDDDDNDDDDDVDDVDDNDDDQDGEMSMEDNPCWCQYGIAVLLAENDSMREDQNLTEDAANVMTSCGDA